MLQKIKNTVKDSAIYSLGTVSTKLIGLVLLPIYTEHLTQSEYGTFALLEISNQILVSIFMFGLPQAFLRWGADKKYENLQDVITFNSYFFSILFALGMYFLLAFFDTELSILLFESPDYEFYFSYLLIWSGLALVNKIPITLIRIQEKAKLFAIFNIIKFTSILLLNIYFVAIAKLGVIGIIYGQTLGEVLFFVITLPLVIKNSSPKVDPRLVKQMLAFGFPLMFSAVSSFLLSFADRYIMKYLLDLSAVGIYSVGYKFGSVINVFLLQSFSLGFIPIAYKMLDQPNAKRFFSKSFTYFIFVLAICVLGLSVYSKEIVMLIADEKFNEAYTIIPLIALGFLVRGSFIVFSLPFQFVKKTRIKGGLVVFGALLSIIFNFIFIPTMNYYGAAVAMLLSYLTMSLISHYLARHYYYIKYEMIRVIKMLGLLLGLYFISLPLNQLNIIFAISFKLLLVISYPFILYLFNFYEPIELERIKGSWKKWRNPANWKKQI